MKNFDVCEVSSYYYRSIMQFDIFSWYSLLNCLVLCNDFLTISYDIGGVMNVMALSRLFILMTQHGLEYLNFYEKLYALLVPSIFMAKHRSNFFQVMLINPAVVNWCLFIFYSYIFFFCLYCIGICMSAGRFDICNTIGLLHIDYLLVVYGCSFCFGYFLNLSY